MTASEGLAEPAPWFSFARSLLLAAASRVQAEERSTDTAPGESTPPVDVEAGRSEFHASLGGASPFAALAANAGMSGHSAEVFALLAAAEVDANLAALVRRLNGELPHGRMTLGLLQATFGSTHLGALAVAENSLLRRCAFVTVQPDRTWAEQAVVLHPGVLWALIGDGSPDPELPDRLAHHTVLTEGARGERGDLVLVNGADRMRRRSAGAAAGVADLYLCANAPDEDAAWAALVREATITGRGIVVDVDSTLSAQGRRWIERATHLVWVVSARTGPALDELPDRPWVQVEADTGDPTDFEWSETFGSDAPRLHRLTPDQLDRVGSAFARSRRLSDEDAAAPDVGDAIDAAVRRLASGRLETLTSRIQPTRTWEDVVVSPDRLTALRGIAERYRHGYRVYEEWGFSPNPSRGLVALFSGPSGTGKTLTAEVIAGDLGLDLFKLDLSSVVSKYIGETEKNLEQIFDAASAGNLVLFFDEADALFGKRSEVKDARDRYANIEVSYLLQRLEVYDGLVVLATNFEKNVDEAFLRRIHARVQFASPGPEERLEIWRINLPASAPIGDLDLEWISKQFELAGGVIRNAAMQAAFLAAEDGDRIEMRHLVFGVAQELKKMGRLLRESDFGEYHDLLDL